jgi:hypothetical protein
MSSSIDVTHSSLTSLAKLGRGTNTVQTLRSHRIARIQPIKKIFQFCTP